MRKTILTAAALVALSMPAFAQSTPETSFQNGIKSMIANIVEQRDAVCSKQADPSICKIRFSGPIAIASGIGFAATTAAFKAASGDRVGLDEQNKKVKQGFDDLQAALAKLAQDYK